MIKSKQELQKVVMLNSNKWWDIDDLTVVMREKLPKYGFTSMRSETISRNIRLFREPKFALLVEKKQIGPKTFIFKVSSRNQIQECSSNQYANRK
jgi:hypothetical protein